MTALARRPTIVLLTGNSLCHNPRALKEATTLARAGYDVRVLGAWHDATLKARDLKLIPDLLFDFVPVLDATQSGALQLARRVRGRVAKLAHDVTRWESARQLGAATRPMLRDARRSEADLYIAHSEVGLVVARALLRQGKRVAVDMEDWFSEDLPTEAQRHRPQRLLRSLEREVLRGGACAFCPSEAMATALAGAHGCRKPTVIYNAFSWADRAATRATSADRRDPTLPSLYWFSQTLGPERGIEDLVAALPLMRTECEIHLRGKPAAGFADFIATQLPARWRGRIVLHDLVDNAALLSCIAAHDVGFAGELPAIRSRDLTVSNKILHYLLGGLPVVASDTAGQQEVARQAPEAVTLYRAGDAPALARRLDALLASPGQRASARAAALVAARATFCWERQEQKLADAVAAALAAQPEGVASACNVASARVFRQPA